MTDAAGTALRVLAWAVDPVGPPPTGPLRHLAALARPSAALRDLVGRLAWCTAAQLGAGNPPLGDRSPVGLGAVLLAAAVGARAEPELAENLTRSVPPPTGWSDALVRHGVVGAALDDEGLRLLEALADALIEASPLSAVVRRPGLRRLKAGTTQAAVDSAVWLIEQPRGARLLSSSLAVPSHDQAVLAWRAELLDRLRHDHLDVVLDTYLTARVRHGQAWDERIRWAERELSSLGLPSDLAIATARYWAPLAAVDRNAPGHITTRRYLTGHGRAIDLVRRHHQQYGGAA